MKYDQGKGDRSFAQQFEQEGLVECSKDSSTYCVHLVLGIPGRALQLKKSLLSYLLWPMLGFLISFLFCTYSR